MGSSWSAFLGEAIGALLAGETARAKEAFERLQKAASSYSSEESSALSSAWEHFIHLLHRRGYFVLPPAKTQVALEEIREMGAGFDLYDLAAAIAKCDRALAEHLCAPESRAFPELRAFSLNHGGLEKQ